MYCRFCGTEVGSEQKHCRKCGAKQPVDNTADGNLLSGADGLATITKMFILICLFLMFIAGLKMLGDDNYIGLVFVVLGFGSLIYGLYWWQNRRVIQFQKSERDSAEKLDSEDEKLLTSSDGQHSVIEDTTRQLKSAKLRRNQ